MAKKNQNKVLLPIAAVLFITAITMVLMIFGHNRYPDVINKGVFINGVDVGNLSQDAATRLLNKKFNQPFSSKQIKLEHNNRTFTIDYKSLKAHYDVNKAVAEAYQYAKKDGLMKNVMKNLNLQKSHYTVEMKFLADTSDVEHIVRKIARKLNYDPVDAKIKLVGDTFTVTNDKTGRSVDQKKLTAMIKASVTPGQADETISIPVDTVEAHIRAEMLTTVDTIISSFTTHFNTGDRARSSNIQIAAGAVDGTVVLPGEDFSMNKAVGPRIASKGYQEAHVIIKGRLTTGLAGGICQATTTVYNAALMANFDIVERKNHGLRVGYVKPGFDATISGDYLDMKFKNTNKTPIYVHTIVKNGTVTVQIYGTQEHPGQTVELSSTVLERIDPAKPEYIYDSSLRAGVHIVDSKAIEGMRSVSYRKVFLDGKLIKTETLSKDRYSSSRAIIRVGTKKS